MAVQPQKLWDQFSGKAHAELQRGSGWWPAQNEPVPLEPPWDPFDRRVVTPWDCWVNDWGASYYGGPIVLERGERLSVAPDPFPYSEHHDLFVISFAQFGEDSSTIRMTDQLLHALLSLEHPVAFELLGCGALPQYDNDLALKILQARANGPCDQDLNDAIVGWTTPHTSVQFAVRQPDLPLLEQQLAFHFPNSSVVATQPLLPFDFNMALNDLTRACCVTLALDGAYAYPLRTFNHLDPDPLAPAIAAMERLERDEWALLQVLFFPARAPWNESLNEAVVNPYKGDVLFADRDEIGLIKKKFDSPLFAVSIRLLSSRADVVKHLMAWSRQFDNSPRQRLSLNQSEWTDGAPSADERGRLQRAVEDRCTFWPGMLLNAQELASLIHIPDAEMVSERLRRVSSRTRPAVEVPEDDGSVVLGENVHRGKVSKARIPAKLRARHCYVAGATGTGKSTLLLNLILQDIERGRGVGVLDPHGDLIKDVLRRLPDHRLDDVILFDPSDEAHPFALNIIEAKDDNERERIVSETVMALERYFPASWGPRLERILTYTIHTVLHALPHPTLADVERMLTSDDFRAQVILKTKNARLKQFWTEQFIHFPKNAVDPVLNKLSVFLMNRTVRNIICQPTSSIDFDHILNNGKIFLANLSSGLLTEKVANTLGSFLVTKVVNAAMRRADRPEHTRRPWYLYVDEFQSFMNVSVGFDRILTESRKYKLVLAGLANQYVAQLDNRVRAAIFGNVGVLATFRLGVDDANLLSREMGAFEAEEIMNLELGEAIARVEVSKKSFNIMTYPPPDLPKHDPSEQVIEKTRQHYSRPRKVVEQEINASVRPFQAPRRDPPPHSTKDAADSTNHPDEDGREAAEAKPRGPQPMTRRKRRRKRGGTEKRPDTPRNRATDKPPSTPRKPKPKPTDPVDPSEDDLIQ